ncbi:MAG: hypothetical protein AAGK09_07770 [Planctomycetota bacterium]
MTNEITKSGLAAWRRRFVVWALVLGIVPHLLLILAAWNYYYYTVLHPPRVTFPGDPDIGLGFLILAAISNIPALLAWLGFFIAR